MTQADIWDFSKFVNPFLQSRFLFLLDQTDNILSLLNASFTKNCLNFWKYNGRTDKHTYVLSCAMRN